ncbi:PRA1 family protein 3 [Aedes albopictus]|uniref:PRA1 family protein n=1 Tax=Aedes albopictus TaxID=7160 RepID=A0A023EIC2_AEDAL|nr:PRA1 family protein 3-like [Aedes albopictus]XP_029735643.1 PRA1 family protein 3-like [Aedes albopictus]XP_029735644.1 PRA1 family protein 3-like [Aedes albopictus]XP_029735650.1 PRA1 family protein 3 [Aedes albopictus]XP_029735651.1 PRA1 family protein 3 [Aedes albopictus]XP_029735652.1 PRA1 family protein 3 [Aedes albopictus]XP_029736002.1 PRA1 family protein 3-like [Aedes albopictus]
MTSTQTGSSLQLAPLRSVNDFLLESARFQLPNFQDFEKWGNRVVKNLLYYQTNYLLMSAAVFLLVGLIHPYKVILGLMVIMALLYVFVKFFTAEARRSFGAASGQQPQPNKWAVLGGVLGCCYLVLFMFDAVLIVMFAVLLPFSLTFVHASLRLRNIKNKITNTIEVVGVKQSPMGQFLEAMGLMPEAF